VATLAAYPGMMQRFRKREGLRVCRAAWLVGVSVREYREIEAGAREPSLDTYEWIFELYGWPQSFTGGRTSIRASISATTDSDHHDRRRRSPSAGHGGPSRSNLRIA
jgi:transcriptional regulator with XRE-family HTH domain